MNFLQMHMLLIILAVAAAAPTVNFPDSKKQLFSYLQNAPESTTINRFLPESNQISSFEGGNLTTKKQKKLAAFIPLHARSLTGTELNARKQNFDGEAQFLVADGSEDEDVQTEISDGVMKLLIKVVEALRSTNFEILNPELTFGNKEYKNLHNSQLKLEISNENLITEFTENMSDQNRPTNKQIEISEKNQNGKTSVIDYPPKPVLGEILVQTDYKNPTFESAELRRTKRSTLLGEFNSEEDYPPLMPYRFAFEVRDDETSTLHSRTEFVENGILRGNYSYLGPDGFLRTFTYRDEGSGFQVDLQQTKTEFRFDDEQSKELSESSSEESSELNQRELVLLHEPKIERTKSSETIILKNDADSGGLSNGKKSFKPRLPVESSSFNVKDFSTAGIISTGDISSSISSDAKDSTFAISDFSQSESNTSLILSDTYFDTSATNILSDSPSNLSNNNNDQITAVDGSQSLSGSNLVDLLVLSKEASDRTTFEPKEQVTTIFKTPAEKSVTSNQNSHNFLSTDDSLAHVPESGSHTSNTINAKQSINSKAEQNIDEIFTSKSNFVQAQSSADEQFLLDDSSSLTSAFISSSISKSVRPIAASLPHPNTETGIVSSNTNSARNIVSQDSLVPQITHQFEQPKVMSKALEQSDNQIQDLQKKDQSFVFTDIHAIRPHSLAISPEIDFFLPSQKSAQINRVPTLLLVRRQKTRSKADNSLSTHIQNSNVQQSLDEISLLSEPLQALSHRNEKVLVSDKAAKSFSSQRNQNSKITSNKDFAVFLSGITENSTSDQQQLNQIRVQENPDLERNINSSQQIIQIQSTNFFRINNGPLKQSSAFSLQEDNQEASQHDISAVVDVSKAQASSVPAIIRDIGVEGLTVDHLKSVARNFSGRSSSAPTENQKIESNNRQEPEIIALSPVNLNGKLQVSSADASLI